MRVTRLPQRHGIDQIDMAGHEHGKGGFGLVPGILAQQGQVGVRHFIDISPPLEKGNNLFRIPVPKRLRPLNLISKTQTKQLSGRQTRRLGLLSSGEQNDCLFVDFDFVGRRGHRRL
jgi:hypothetical protein